MSWEVKHGDNRELLASLDADSVDAVVCDPPYELTNGRKTSPHRIALEVLFPKEAKLVADRSDGCELAGFAVQVVDLCLAGDVPGPAPTMPVSAMALNHETANGQHDVQYESHPAAGITDPDASSDFKPEAAKHLGCFTFELTDREAALEELDRSGASLFAGCLRVGLRVGAASIPRLLHRLAMVIRGGDHVRALNDAFAVSVRALRGAEDLAMTWLTSPGTSEHRISAASAFHLLAVAELVGAKLVRTRAGAGGLAPVLQPVRVCVISPTAGRAITFDLLIHPVDVTRSGFMGKDWDGTGIAFDPEFWREVYRVLKPGAHVVAFGGTRTYHRMACAIEDAGFEVRDSLHWVYTQGFPKSLDVSKAIDKAAGAERDVIAISNTGIAGGTGTHAGADDSYGFKASFSITAPATPEAKQWSGWGTALKPAHEPIVLARKPLAGTVAANVLQWGTGAVNVEGCRVGTNGGTKCVGPSSGKMGVTFNGSLNGQKYIDIDAGRWPPNVILSHCPDCGTTCIPGCAVDEMERQSASSRMFPCFRYEPKPSRGEREAGCEALPTRSGAEAVARDEGSAGTHSPAAGSGRMAERIANVHPTVKSIDLMRWLCRLVTPPAGLVLDPFCGSGTTGCAAVLEGFQFLGMEREAEYVDIANARISYWAGQSGAAVDADKFSDKPTQLGLWGTR